MSAYNPFIHPFYNTINFRRYQEITISPNMQAMN